MSFRQSNVSLRQANDLRVGVFPTPYPNAVENERDGEKGKIQASDVVDETELSTAFRLGFLKPKSKP